MCSLGSHGLWPLHCNLQAPPLVCPHAPSALLEVGVCGLGSWASQLPGYVSSDYEAAMMGEMYGETFSMWDASSDKNCLCEHSGCGEHCFHLISNNCPGAPSLILISYSYIALAVLRIKSATGRRKAFNMCGSHLTVVSLFYGNIIYMYMQPGNSSSQDQGKFLTLFYNLVTPMLNPVIYTLRNKDVMGALKRFVSRK